MSFMRVAILASTLLTSLVGAAQSEVQAQTTLRIGIAEDPDILDPSIGRTYVGRIVFSAFCDKLFDIDEKLNIVPQLALSHETSADGKEMTIKLRPGVKFHDGEPLDADCSIETRHEWYYRSVLSQGFEKLADPYAAYPADTLNVETFDGRAVPYVVRVESATINRGIARIAVLDDPHARGADAPFAPTWNRRVYYVFGESCGVGYHQGLNQVGFVLGSFIDNASSISTDAILINLVGIDQRLGQGDVVVHSTLSAFGNHCNPLISIETAMMVKEHITEQYGLIDAVVGTNGSGAALQQYNAANNAPGLINAAMPTATFADILSTAMTVGDCGLLVHYYEHSALDWNDLKRAAVDGHNLLTGTQLNSICQSWVGNFLPNIDPAEGCSDAVPRELRYDPANNPGGVRCTLQDGNVNIYGRIGIIEPLVQTVFFTVHDRRATKDQAIATLRASRGLEHHELVESIVAHSLWRQGLLADEQGLSWKSACPEGEGSFLGIDLPFWRCRTRRSLGL